MRLNKENYELVMFDLLEGNLPDKEALQAMKQIEEDEFFFREWKLFKSTILITDKDVVYSNKEGLLKKEIKVVPLFKWASIAAAACIVIGLFFVFPFNNGNEVAEEINPQIETPVIEEPIIPTEVIVPIAEVVLAKEETHPLKVKAEKNVIYKSVVNEPIFVKEVEDIVVNKYEDILPVPIFTKDVIEESPEEVIVQDNTPEYKSDATIIEPAVINNNPKKTINNQGLRNNALAFVTNSPRQRIKDKTNEILALVSNPKVKFKPQFEDKRPSLQIEVETAGYQAIASLTPFKNKRN